MAKNKADIDSAGEFLVAWKKYKATRDDELTLNEGDVVELLDTIDPEDPAIKRIKLDPDLDSVKGHLLDSSAAKHKLSVKPKRTKASARHSPSRINLETRWLVREISGGRKQGWIPCGVLQSVDDPVPGSGLPGDAAFRRQAVVRELVETEQEFVRDLDSVVQKYLLKTESGKVPKIVKDNFELVFGNLKEIAEFHRTVLMEGVKYYADEPLLLGKAFLRLERDFDKHVRYCSDEPQAQSVLDTCDEVRDFFDELSQRLGDDKTISEHLKLPIQRINDYQLLLKELVRYSACLGEEHGDLQKALELMLSIPHRAQDDKFTSSIEGYRGSIYKLGRLLAHDWFSVNLNGTTKERYLFLFKARILICKVRRISDDRSVFQLKDIIRLPQVEVRDHPEDGCVFELIEKSTGNILVLTARRDHIKDFWLKEIKEYASDADETGSDEFQVISPPTETSKEEEPESKKAKLEEPKKPNPKPEESKPIGNPKTPESAKVGNPTPIEKTNKKEEPESKKEKLEEPKKPNPKPEESKPVANPKTPETPEVNNPTPIEVSKTESVVKQVSSVTETSKVQNTSVGVELKAEGEEMSRRQTEYSSSSRAGGYSSSSYSRRTGSSYTSDRYTSDEPSSLVSKYSAEKSITSKYSTEPSTKLDDLSSKYGVESSLSKYDALASKYGKSLSDTTGKYAESSVSYNVRSSGDAGDGDGYSYTKRTSIRSSAYGDDDDFDSRRSIRSRGRLSEDDEENKYSKYSRRALAEADEYGESGSYSRRSIRSIEEKGDGRESSFSYSRSSERKAVAKVQDDDYDVSSYLKRKGIAIDDDDKYSKYSRRTSQRDDDDLTSKYSRTSSYNKDDDDDVKSKYSRKSSYKEDEDKSRKYSRTSSYKEDSEQDYSRKYSRLDSSAKLNSKKSLESDEVVTVRRTTEISATNGTETADSISLAMKTTKEGDKPIFTKTLRGSNIEPGDTASFEVALAEPPDNLFWLKDNKPVNGNGSLSGRIISNASEDYKEFHLQIKQVEANDSGLYTAVAVYSKNKNNKATCSAQLVVHELSAEERAERTEHDKPEFTIQLKDTELLEDTYLRFMVKVNGDPNPDIAFFKDGVKIPEHCDRCQIIREHSDKGFYELVIPSVKQADAGVYKCVASNKFGEASSEAKVTVTDTKNLFDDLPDKELLPPGEKPSFLWKKDGKPFEPEERFKVLLGDDEDSLALIFQHVRPDDVGLYTCVAQTSRGHISCSAELTVHGTVNQLFKEPEKPKLVIEKREALATVGESAMMELQVKGFPKPKVKWTHEGKPIEPSGKYKFLYEDDETMSLVIKNVESSDAGKYKISAENELGKDEAEVSLTLKAAPKIKKKLENMSVSADDTLKLTIEVEGLPKPTVLFYKDGEEIKKTERIKVVEEGQKHTLVIEKTNLKDTGSYSVVASNEISDVSQFARINVYTKPKLLKKLGKDIQVRQEETVELSVKVEAEPAAEVSWFKDEEELSASDHYLISKDGDTYILKISGAVTTDSAKYKVKAVNIHGSVDDEVRVDVKRAPKILKPLEDMTVTEHDTNVTFDVKLEAFPKPTVKWYLDEMEISETRSEFTRLESDDGVKLVIKEVSSDLSGRYTCKVRNDLGETETSAKLTVNCKPRILKQLKNETVEEGATLHLEVEVDACPEPTVKWLRNGKEITSDARIKISRDKQRYETYDLAVNLIKYEEEGEYEVVVTNELGTVSSKSYVTVHKVTHTDAIEESEEPPKKITVEVLEDEPPQKGRKAEIVEIEEIPEEEPKKPDIEEIEEKPEKVKGGREKSEAKEKIIKIQSPEPLVEEPASPQAPITPVLGMKEDAEIIEIDVSKPEQVPQITDVKKKRVSRGKSLQFEMIEEEEVKIEQETPLTEDVSKPELKSAQLASKEEIKTTTKADESEQPKIEEVPKLEAKRGLSVTEEKSEIVEFSVDSTRRKSVEEEIEQKLPHRAVEAFVEEATVEAPQEDLVPKTKEVPKGKPQRAISVQKEESESGQVEEEVSKVKEEKIESAKIQKGVKVDDDELDDEVEALLQRAKKQRSLIEEVKLKDEEPEAIPSILETNMQDTSRPASLDITYVVKGTANPPPTVTWTHDGKEIKPDSNLRMTASQNGEEFKLEIRKLDMKDAGVYQCVLSNPLGDVRQQAILEITPEKELRRPKVKEGLQDQTIVKKNTVTLKAVVVCDPIPDVTWYHNGKELTASEFEKYKMILETEDHEIGDGLKECTYSLTIPRCDRINEGKYKMKAENKWGECESSAELTIVLRPEIEGPDDVTVVPGEATQFVVVIRANPAPVVTWTKDDQIIQTANAFELIEDAANETYKLIIHKVQLSDEGYYKVTAKNKLGEDYKEARLKTIKEQEPSTEKPKIITNLTDDQVDDKGEVTLMIRADGLPKPEIRWFLNGKPIVEDFNHQIQTQTETQVVSSLTISNYSEDDVGIYKAVAVNCAGEAETTARVSMLQTPPTFGVRLDRTADVDEGEPLELKAKISGSPKPTVAWFKDSEPLPKDDERIKTSILPDGSVKLQIENVKPSDSGAYKLVVRNPNGETAALCAVAVNQKPQRPKFLKCFKDAKITIGEPLRLEAKLEAYPPPEIKWYKDGVQVRPSSNIHFEQHPDGTVALVVDYAKPENAGSYQLVASNKLGETTGDANVRVERKPTKPEFLLKLSPLTVVEGFPVKLEVKATGYPKPTIKWTRNDVEVIADNKHIKITELEDETSVLVIDSTDQSRDSLTYKAVASNEVGEAVTAAALRVTPSTKAEEPEERPQFIYGLKGVITDEGQPLVIEAPFTGNPIPSVEWFKDGEPLKQTDRMLLTCDGKKVALHISNAMPSDAGQYQVKITNPLGSDSSEAKVVVHKVFQPPNFTQRFTDLQQMPGRDAKFPARVTGVPQPEVTWYKDGVALEESDKIHIKRDGDMCCLYISNCEPSDAGLYRAIASNKEGQDTCTATLEVVKEIKSSQKIEPPVFLKRIGDTELYKAMTAKFTACASGIPEPTVEWYRNDQKIYPSERIRMEMDRAGLLRLSISNVDQDDIGKYTCKISNEHGSDICHAHLSFAGDIEPKPKRPITDQYTEFEKYKRSGEPMPLHDAPIISQMTDRNCTLSWKPSIPTGPRTPVTYQLEMCELPQGDWFTVRSGIRSCTCGVRNLEPFRDYKFRVRVENKYGVSDPSPYALTHREKLEPELPKFRPYLPPDIDFRPETSPYFPKDFDIERPPHDNMAQAPRFLRQEHDCQYGVKDQNTNLFWFVYGYPKPKVSFYFNDELIESGGRFDMSYTRNGQATLFINKMLERDVGWYEAVAKNEHGEARQRVRLEIAELPHFIRRPEIEYTMLRERAQFEARIVGVPYPEIKWYKDWKPLAPSSRIKILFREPDTTTLIINDVIMKDEGLYSVSARNVAGTASSSAMLHIEENDLEYNVRTYSNLSPIRSKRKPFTDNYDIGDELGRGTQGITYHAVERINGRNYAAKIMHGRGDVRPFMDNELDVLNQLRHRKLISLHDSYETDDTLALILELGSGGELVRDNLLKMDYYRESDIAGYIRQLLQGLEYMHGKGFGHMGLTLGDLLLSHPGGDDLKISDFGLARHVTMGKLYSLNYGVPEYVSPEAANGEGTGLGHDMWSVGIITYILLSGRSPFRGNDDRETLTNIRTGKWSFDESWWKNISLEGRDFITKLLVYQADGRMDVHTALRHPWLERADKMYSDEFQISSKYLYDYYKLYREWYDNASCKRWYRRRPLEGAFTHPSRMVYPPGEVYTPIERTPAPERVPYKPGSWEDQIPTRSPLNYEIGLIKSESHYQNGPDTYLLQLRDVDFPVRLREYMKVASNRAPGAGYIVSDENGYDWATPVIRERRRFTDVMDEEIDDERKARISRYGSGDNYTIRRLRTELGNRLDTYVEAEAFIESKQEGRLPFFREKPQFTAMIEGKDAELTCFAVGEPQPVVQWFKNDAIIAESHRVKIETDSDGRSHIKFRPALSFDQGMYKVVARNKVGQTIARTRIVIGLIPDEPDSPEATQVSDTEVLLTWKQPKFDGNATVLCYRLDYKLADDMDWTKKADNIDHEFFLITGLEPRRSYIFRLSAKNSIGWSEPGVPSQVVNTKEPGAPKVQLSKAMLHLQRLTDSGAEVEPEVPTRPDYTFEQQPVEWIEENPEDNYTFISEIARGRFSTVLKALDKRNDRVVVAKLLALSNRVDDVEGEFAALRSLRHERVSVLLEAYKTSDIAYFVLEKLQGADILTYLSAKHEYTEQTVATIVSQILDGLQYLHWRGLCHLDLQPDNVVMCSVRSVQIKLVDLGSAHRVTKLGTKVPVVGHPQYISPEVLSEEPAFPQTDIWSVGVIAYVLLSGTEPFKGEDDHETRQNILFVRYRFEHLYKELSQEATRFLMLLFKRHPNKRPSAEECHENRWLLPTDYMIKKRERAVFLGNRLKDYSEHYHEERVAMSQYVAPKIFERAWTRSHSIQEELLTAP